MSRGYDFEERDSDREQELKQAPPDRSPVAQGRGGGNSDAPEGDRLRSQRGLARSPVAPVPKWPA